MQRAAALKSKSSRRRSRVLSWKQATVEVLSLAINSIRSHRFQSALTLLGIILGVATVIVVVSVIQGLDNSVNNAVARLNPNIFIVARAGIDDFGFGNFEEVLRKRPPFRYLDYLAIRDSCPSVSVVSPFHSSNIFSKAPSVIYRDQEAQNPIVRGIEPFYMEATGFFVTEGRAITEIDSLHKRDVCLLGASIVDGLFPHIDPVGKQVRIDGHPFDVIGILERREVLIDGPSENQLVLIPFGTFTKYYTEHDLEFLQFICMVRDPLQMDQAIGEVRTLLRHRRNLRYDQTDNFALFKPDQFLQIWHDISDGVFLLMIVIASIGLVVGGIGVMNIMLISVAERVSEIGIRKAVGARRRDILWQFLLEAMILTTIGGVFGILAGVATGSTLQWFFPSLKASFSAWSVAAGLLVSTSVGLFFGLWPANRAARLDPIQALHHER